MNKINYLEIIRLSASIKTIALYGRDSFEHRRIKTYCAIKNWINYKKIAVL
jgi:hypothetical protein